MWPLQLVLAGYTLRGVHPTPRCGKPIYYIHQSFVATPTSFIINLEYDYANTCSCGLTFV